MNRSRRVVLVVLSVVVVVVVVVVVLGVPALFRLGNVPANGIAIHCS